MITPKIIQGGMGVYISDPFLAKTVSMTDVGMGTVSGVLAGKVLARILERGDPGGHYRRTLAHFPFPEKAEKVLATYYVAGGISSKTKFKSVPMFDFDSSELLISLEICANFALVWLAKEGHNNPVSINYLEKIQIPLIYALMGAMLAGVDCVTMGAGVPLQIPGILDRLTLWKDVSYRVDVIGGDSYSLNFDPKKFFGQSVFGLNRPDFLPIISSNLLAKLFHKLNKKIPGSVQGFIVEGPTAGGHNAPARKVEGKIILDDFGQPVYGNKDKVDFSELSCLGIPFWIAGSKASPEALAEALALGAVGIQVGTIFALSRESNMDNVLKQIAKRSGYLGDIHVFTSLLASPSGFPFKVANVQGTLSDDDIYRKRIRICDQGCLRTPYYKSDGTIGFRCSAENVDQYIRKGGKLEDTARRCCLGNALFATASLGNPKEPAIVTLGDDVSFLRYLMSNENDIYCVTDVMEYLLGSG